MLERIREGSQGIAAKVILGLVIASFAFAGVGSYINMRGEITAADVNGTEITQRDFEQAFQNERARMEQQFGEMFGQLASNPEYMANFKNSVLDRLISKELSDQQAAALNLRISDKQIKDAIFAMPEFQVDGKFDNSRYLQVISRAGYQASQFREMLRADMTRGQLLQALTDSAFTLENEVTTYTTLQSQTRDFTFAQVDIKQFKQDVTLEPADLDTYYQANLSRFATEEQIALSYIELKVEDLMADVEVSESELKADYEANKSIYTTEERRRASHILIGLGDDEAAAKTKAEALLAEIKSGADFAELAKANSEDTFSGEKGGDLDFFGRGVMASEFEEAAFALAKLNDVSELVQTSFGFHIIKLTDIEAQQVKDFADVKADIATKIKREKANIIFGDKQQQVADLVFEVSDSLDDAAAEAGVTVKNVPLFSRSSAPSALSNPKIIAAAFSTEVAQDGYNSEVIELNSDHIIVVRATDYQPTRTQILDEVKLIVEAAVVEEKAKTAAEIWAQAQLAAWLAGDDITQAVVEKGAELKSVTAIARQDTEVNASIRAKAFSIAKPTAEQTSAAWLHTTNAIALVKLDAVNLVATAENSAADEQRIQQAYADMNYRAFVSALEESASILKASDTAAQ